MKARELTWLRVTEDDNPPYEILLQPGEKIERMRLTLLLTLATPAVLTSYFKENLWETWANEARLFT